MLRTWEVHAHEAGNAAALDLEDVVIRSDGEVVSAKSEGQVGEAVALVTFDCVLAVEALLGTDFLVEELSHGGWEGNERGSGVEDDTSVLKLSSVRTEGNGIQINLPVSLTSQRDGGDVASVVRLVDATENSLRLILLTILGVAEIESEDGFVKKILLDHVVEWRRDLVDGDGVVSETKNAIESTEGKSKTGFLSRFSEKLVLDLNITNGHDVLGDKAAQTSRAITDLERGAVLLISRRGR